MKDRVTRPTPKAVTLVVRMWQGPDGTVKASVKPTDGGEVQHFPDMGALLRYLESRQEGFQDPSEDVQGLR